MGSARVDSQEYLHINYIYIVTSVGPVSALLTPVLAMTEASQEANVAALIGTPALQQIVDKFVDGKSDSEKKELLKKIEVQLVTFNGKEKLSIDEFYSVLKVQFKLDCTKNDIRKVVADLPMDKNYKIVIKDFTRLPILSDDVFKAMDKNNDGQVSKGELKLARKNLTMKQVQSIMGKLDDNGDGTISWKEMKEK